MKSLRYDSSSSSRLMIGGNKNESFRCSSMIDFGVCISTTANPNTSPRMIAFSKDSRLLDRTQFWNKNNLLCHLRGYEVFESLGKMNLVFLITYLSKYIHASHVARQHFPSIVFYCSKHDVLKKHFRFDRLQCNNQDDIYNLDIFFINFNTL